MTQVVKFGKYKGASIEVLRSDPEYCRWLQAQTWFAEKYAELAQTLAQPRSTSSTPAHNALQLKFLDESYAQAFAMLASPGLRAVYQVPCLSDSLLRRGWYQGRIIKSTEPEFEYECEQPVSYRKTVRVAHDVHYQVTARSKVLQEDGTQPELVTRLFYLREQKYHADYYQPSTSIFTPLSEYQLMANTVGVQEAEANRAHNSNIEPLRAELKDLERELVELPAPTEYLSTLRVEVKPTLEDEYPEVLRQVVANGSTFVLVGEFNSAVASLEQVRKIYKSRDKYIILDRDVEYLKPLLAAGPSQELLSFLEGLG